MKKTNIYLLIGLGFFLLIMFLMRKKITSIVKNFKIRNDSKEIGFGYFGASRDGGKRLHSGIDIEVKKGPPIYAPFDLKFERLAIPYKDDPKYKGALYSHDEGTIKIFYFEPLTNNFYFKKGQLIGFAQAINEKYGKQMTNHIHFEMRDNENKLINPEIYV